jgi:hypothetical protein
MARSISDAARSASECGKEAAAFASPATKTLAALPHSKVAGATVLQAVARSGETLRQSEWRDVLLNGGVRGKAGQTIDFARRATRRDALAPC